MSYIRSFGSFQVILGHKMAFQTILDVKIGFEFFNSFPMNFISLCSTSRILFVFACINSFLCVPLFFFNVLSFFVSPLAQAQVRASILACSRSEKKRMR